MQHTLVAVFDNRNDAQKALEDLVASGFSRQEARLSEGDPTGQSSLSSSTDPSSRASVSSDHDTGFGAGIRHFFSDIFGTDRSPDAQMYSDAVTRGHYVLTVTANSEPEVERAADIVERYGPLDIDETAQQWGASDYPDAARMGSTTGMQQSQSMSQQYTKGTDSSLLSGDSGLQGTGSSLQGSDPAYRPATQSSQLGGAQNSQLQGTQQGAGASQTIPVIQEELKVGKRQVERGGVRIYQRVVETPVNESVGLREEHVNVERHAVNRPVSAEDINAFQETTIELRETSEEAVIEKTARVVEEVVVGKEVTQRNEKIRDSVRRTEVEIEQLSPQDDAYFRGHWKSNYANDGGTYDDYAPAYSYGTTSRSSAMYRDRPWDEAEPSLRSDWEWRNPNSTWEKTKAAVRHGWERVTS